MCPPLVSYFFYLGRMISAPTNLPVIRRGGHWPSVYIGRTQFAPTVCIKTDVILSVERRILITVRSFTAFRMTLFFISLWICLSKAPLERSCRALSETEDWYKIKKHKFSQSSVTAYAVPPPFKRRFWNGISLLPRANTVRPYDTNNKITYKKS